MDEVSTARIRVLEALTLATCPADHEIRLGSWVLRCGQSNVMRANTISVFADDLATEVALSERLKSSVDWYQSQGAKIHFRLSEHPAAMAVDRALARFRYEQHDATLVMQIADLPSLNLSAPAAGSPPYVQDVQHVQHVQYSQPKPIDTGTATEWRMVTRGESVESAANEAAAARDYGCSADINAPTTTTQAWLDGIIASAGLLDIPAQAPLRRKSYACAIYDVQQTLIASGVARICDAHVGIFNIFTLPEHRGQGCGTAITQALLKWAQTEGARTAFLQVVAENSSAIKVYARFGFIAAYRYHYRRQP